MSKLLVLTAHAAMRLQTRRIDPKWIEDAVLAPDWVEQDPREPNVDRRFRAIQQFGGRILRVACVETNSTVRVISVLFDRNARRKP
jgi:hypothetical protein